MQMFFCCINKSLFRWFPLQRSQGLTGSHGWKWAKQMKHLLLMLKIHRRPRRWLIQVVIRMINGAAFPREAAPATNALFRLLMMLRTLHSSCLFFSAHSFLFFYYYLCLATDFFLSSVFKEILLLLMYYSQV